MDDIELSDDAFLALVGSGRIVRFGHREHLRLAFLAVQRSATPAEAIARCRTGIRAVAQARGAADRYDEAITESWVSRMLDATRSLPAATFDELLERRPELSEHPGPSALPTAPGTPHTTAT